MFKKSSEIVILVQIVLYNLFIMSFTHLFSQTISIQSAIENLNMNIKVIHRLDQIQDSSIVYLGNPFKIRYPDGSKWEYSRNVWDTELWHEKIYFGHGDIRWNAGPIDVWYYDISQQQFINEFTVDEEEIHRFREFNDYLYIPGYDATESLDFGNFYINKGEGWKKYRTIPGEIHVNDISVFHDTLFATGSRGLYASADSGLTWHNYEKYYGGSEFFVFKGQLYCSRLQNLVYHYIGNDFVEEYVEFIPSSGTADHIVNFKGDLIYGSRLIDIYSATSVDNYEKVDLFSAKTPRDIIIKGDTLFVLLSTEWGNDYLTEVFSTGDLESWNNEFQIITPCFVRSFEYFSGSYYISLGAEYYPNMYSVKPEKICGDIYRITPAYWDKNLPSKTATVSPPNLEFSVTRNPTLFWRTTHNATQYTMQYSTNELFESGTTITVNGIIDTSYTISDPLPEYSIWYWRVRAENQYGQSEYSTPSSFMVYPDYQVPCSSDIVTDSMSSSKIKYGNKGNIIEFEYPKESGLTQIRQYYRNQIWVGAECESGSLAVVPLVHAFPWYPTSLFSTESFFSGIKNRCQYSDESNDYTLGPGIRVIQNIYSWENENISILEYTLYNTGRNGKLSNLYWAISLNLAPTSSADRAGQPDDIVGYDSNNKLSYVYDKFSGSDIDIVYVGVASLNNTPSSHRFWDQDAPYTLLEKYEAMSSGYIQPTPNSENFYQIMQAIGPFQLEPKDTINIAVALVWGKGFANIQESCKTAKEKYSQIITEVESIPNISTDLPKEFELFQNFPNPFNSSTKIYFQIPERSKIEMKIFNMLGEEIQNVNGYFESGTHFITWDASGVPSGIYFCAIKTQKFRKTIKMILMR